jgi:hypothetical protein
MKILNHFKLVLLIAVFFIMAGYAYSYPPDNAAVLYYKAAMLYEVDSNMANMLEDLREGKTEVNDKIKEFVKKNRLIIDTVLDASEIKNCDWGLDFSQGLDAMMPPLGNFKKLTYLIIADAKILTQNGDYDAAISRCMSLYKMARHINDRIYVSYLVGISINGVTNNCIMQIMSDMPQDMQSLTRLKNQLIAIDSIPLSVKPAILGEREAMLMFMTPEKMADIARLCVDKESDKGKILSLDETAINRNRAYYENYCDGVIAAFDMPYLQGYKALTDLQEKIVKDANNPNTMLACFLAPSVDKIFSIATRFKTHNNAIMAAVELYMIKTKTGKLPDGLPAELPGDLFSDKPFAYEKTAEGFILRCQGQDLPNNETYEYKFKVK